MCVPPHGQLLVSKCTKRIIGVLNVYGIRPFFTAYSYENTYFFVYIFWVMIV